LFVAFDAIPNPFQISIAHSHSHPEFARWQQLRVCGITVDFRLLLRIEAEFGHSNDFLIEDSVWKKNRCLGYLIDFRGKYIGDVRMVHQ
jgi:hypothetical protein